MPEGVDADQYDIIGKDVTRILHREPAKVWVEVIERPILRAKSEQCRPKIGAKPLPQDRKKKAKRHEQKDIEQTVAVIGEHIRRAPD